MTEVILESEEEPSLNLVPKSDYEGNLSSSRPYLKLIFTSTPNRSNKLIGSRKSH